MAARLRDRTGARRPLVAILVAVLATVTAITTAHALPGTTSRISGADRYATAAAISQRINPSSGVVVVTTGENFPDALSAGPLAASVNSSLLLVRRSSVPAPTLAELQRIRPSTIWLVGGPSVVEERVAEELRRETGATVVRVSGPDRYTTSLLVAEQFSRTGYLTIATGRSFEDAMLGGALAARENGVLLLVAGDRPLTAAQIRQVTRLRPFGIRVIGTTSGVSAAVVDQLRAAAPAAGILRVGNGDVHTRAVSLWERTNGGVGDVAFATSANWPDGLVAAPLLAAEGRILLLSTPTCIPQVAAGLVERTSPSSLLLIGGESALSSAVANETVCT
jgi:hypothetical protein